MTVIDMHFSWYEQFPKEKKLKEHLTCKSVWQLWLLLKYDPLIIMKCRYMMDEAKCVSLSSNSY